MQEFSAGVSRVVRLGTSISLRVRFFQEGWVIMRSLLVVLVLVNWGLSILLAAVSVRELSDLGRLLLLILHLEAYSLVVLVLVKWGRTSSLPEPLTQGKWLREPSP